MFDATFLAILEKEGVAPIVTWNDEEPNLAASWNSYIHKTEDNRLLIPVYGMQNAQDNLAENKQVKMIIGSKEVQGKFGPGAGFLVLGKARIVRDGKDLEMIQERFDWAECLMEVTVSKVVQTE